MCRVVFKLNFQNSGEGLLKAEIRGLRRYLSFSDGVSLILPSVASRLSGTLFPSDSARLCSLQPLSTF